MPPKRSKTIKSVVDTSTSVLSTSSSKKHSLGDSPMRRSVISSKSEISPLPTTDKKLILCYHKNDPVDVLLTKELNSFDYHVPIKYKH